MTAGERKWYRPDIDGLRAVAVVAVILFHADVAGFAGGYVGVDVFFVISGFLITSIIIRQIQQGTFSIARFWDRRVRRIVPALTVVLLTTAAAGYWLLLYPLDYLDFGQSLLAQSVFLSNLFFLRKSDYFASAAEESPLLHTWSLAIEEQFYIIFPLLVLLLWRLGRRVMLWSLLLVALGSLAWSQYLLMSPGAAFSIPGLPPLFAAASNATAAFYLLPTRAFELLVGALLALVAWQVASRVHANFLAGIGTGLVIGSVFLYSEETLFPGLAALLPALGTACLIVAHATHTSVVHQVLRYPVLVWVGLLSYSLYLWHWPVLVLGRYYFATEELSATETVGLLGLTVSLSVLTYHLVEVPVRSRASHLKSRYVLFAGVAALTLVGGIGYYIMNQQGVQHRAPEAAQAIALASTDFGDWRSDCFVHSFEFTKEPCRFGPTEREATHLVIGDSHAGAILQGIAAAAAEAGVTVETYIGAGCSPLMMTNSEDTSRCRIIHQLFAEKLQSGDITDVLLVSRWTNYREDIDQFSLTELEQQFETAVADTIEYLESFNVRIHVLLQVPHHTYYEPRTLFYDVVRGAEVVNYALPRHQHDDMQSFVSQTWRASAADRQVSLLDPTPLLCSSEFCNLTYNDQVIYQDSNHLNATGALLLTPLLVEWLQFEAVAVE